jgi:hypothetical protein
MPNDILLFIPAGVGAVVFLWLLYHLVKFLSRAFFLVRCFADYRFCVDTLKKVEQIRLILDLSEDSGEGGETV